MKVTLENVTKRYKDADRELTVIRDVSFEFPESGTVAIVGRSGIGKSTLLHLIGGIDSVTAGTLTVGDKRLSEMSQDELGVFRGENVGFVFQFHHLLHEFTALENVMMPFTIRGFSDEDGREVSENILKRVGLGDRINHLPSQLSGGEQQRVALARAAVTKPALLLADEPTGNLDSHTSAEIQNLLFELNSTNNSLLIVVAHSLELARSMDLVLEMLPGGELKSL